MASRKKAKAKSKVKRKKTTARRVIARKKKPVKVARKVVKKPRVAKKPASPPPPAPPPGVRIGVVTHYYGHLSVAVVKLEPGVTLRVGDNIHVKGHTSDFGQRVDSLQIGHEAVQEVGPNDDFGLKVAAHAREHDVVYKVKLP